MRTPVLLTDRRTRGTMRRKNRGRRKKYDKVNYANFISGILFRSREKAPL